ncbi:hypothetical protein HJP15_17260 [Pseudoalteromonas sp. NEC-BIFX-2020_002]|uniref:hypothetical protein n=1 Tax=Pseudoalteromonas sp. NEC-BIFX-2020_002 TaxID=2732353 RepID=UPI00147774F4|nr:hypothetical protein [Pseudoalteromonas sp. NEC-BIFX-2020_002]NNG44644.1 hypothetical protein [Pseudoalteromonas sp. NEC-BIFX-2020_002]
MATGDDFIGGAIDLYVGEVERSRQPSAVSRQPSAVSRQPSGSGQLGAVSFKLLGVKIGYIDCG